MLATAENICLITKFQTLLPSFLEKKESGENETVHYGIATKITESIFKILSQFYLFLIHIYLSGESRLN